MLRDGRLSTNAPTLYPNNEELNMNGICFRTYDLGGHETARRIWKEPTSDALTNLRPAGGWGGGGVVGEGGGLVGEGGGWLGRGGGFSSCPKVSPTIC
ncbi:unnamed protein product [Effrenium voratum]|nr:unnamed protein product [Effrenium voratum]